MVVVISFAVEVRNGYVAIDQKLSHRKWQLMNEVIKSPAFKGIPDGSIVVAPTLASHLRGIAGATAEYWSIYTKHKTGKAVRFVNGKCIEGVPCFILVFRQELRSDNQIIILAKASNNNNLTSSDLSIYSLPQKANSVLMGAFANASESPILELNGAQISNVGPGFFSSYWPQVLNNGLTQSVHIKGNVDFFPDQITVSQYGTILMSPGQERKLVSTRD